MFAVELKFDDGISPNEMIIVRRHTFVIGSSDEADVMIEGSAYSSSPICVRRSAGDEFIVSTIGSGEPERVFTRTGSLPMGPVNLVIRPLGLDFVLPPGESMDRAGLRVLRKALSVIPGRYPILSVSGAETFQISLPQNEAILVGRSRAAAVRLGCPSIQAEHALIRVAGEGQVLIEPSSPKADVVASDGSQVLKSRTMDSSFLLGRGAVELRLIAAADDGQVLASPASSEEEIPHRYPCLLSKSDFMRPDRYPLSPGRRVSIGRDPANDVWLNAPHVSRLHAEISINDDGLLEVTDLSSNGTKLNDKPLVREQSQRLPAELAVLDFSRGVTVGICFNGREEEEYLGERRKPRRSSSLHGQILAQIQIPVTPFNSDEDPAEAFPFFVPEAPTAVRSSQLVKSEFFQPVEDPEIYSAQTPRVEEFEEEFEEELLEGRLGLKGRLLYYGSVLFLLVLAYFSWADFLE